MLRKLSDHIVETEGGELDRLEVLVADEPGFGGAHHNYAIQTCGGGLLFSRIQFQNGGVKEVGVNGLTHEALLAVIIDRLRSFQSGAFSCRENAIALTHCEDALMWLQKRTRDRIKRNVEGEMKP